MVVQFERTVRFLSSFPGPTVALLSLFWSEALLSCFIFGLMRLKEGKRTHKGQIEAP